MHKHNPTGTFQSLQKISKAENEIHELMADFAEAISQGNIDEIMGFYGDQVVVFDMMPPLEFMEKEQLQKVAWEDCFTNYFEFPVQFEFQEQKIILSGDVAFTYGLLHMHGTSKSGKDMEARLRYTSCLKKTNGQWKIVHEHKSVPLESSTTKGLMNLKPNQDTH